MARPRKIRPETVKVKYHELKRQTKRIRAYEADSIEELLSLRDVGTSLPLYHDMDPTAIHSAHMEASTAAMADFTSCNSLLRELEPLLNKAYEETRSHFDSLEQLEDDLYRLRNLTSVLAPTLEEFVKECKTATALRMAFAESPSTIQLTGWSDEAVDFARTDIRELEAQFNELQAKGVQVVSDLNFKDVEVRVDLLDKLKEYFLSKETGE